MQTNKYNFVCKIELKAMMVDNIANHNNMNYCSVESQTNKYDNDYICERKLDMLSWNEMLTPSVFSKVYFKSTRSLAI